MIEQYDHTLTTSFLMWFDHTLCQNGAAYVTITGDLWKSQDLKFSGYSAYASAFKQWVADSSVTGAVISSGMYSQGNFYDRNSGAIIDYNNGRVLFTGNNNYPQTSGVFSIKDFNVYYTNTEEQRLLFDTRYVLRPTTYQQLTGLKENEKTYPSIFIKYDPGMNTPYAFGGLDSTNVEFRAVVLSDNDFKLDGVCSIFRDMNQTYVPLLSSNELPFNVLGDFKSGAYNYETLISGKIPLVYISKVRVSKIYDKIGIDVKSPIYGAFIDFDVSIHRYPRI